MKTTAQHHGALRQNNSGVGRVLNKHLVICATVALCLFPKASLLSASAQPYPNRPITMVVPFAAGGPTDIVARIISEPLSHAFNQPIIIENVTGAAGTTGAGRVARAQPDGYTMLMGPMSTMSLSPAFYPNLPFDPLRSFEPVGIVASAPSVLVARMQMPAGTLAEFASFLRANAGTMSNGNAGIGSSSHLGCLLLNARIGAAPSIVPYRGTGPAVQDLAAGQIDYLCDQITSVMGQITAGMIKPLAVLAPTRSPVLPAIPTAAEAGFEGFEMVVWNALFMPKGTPRDIVMRMNNAVGLGIGDTGIRRRLMQLGAEPPTSDQRSPQGLGDTLARDLEKWGAVIRSANVTLE